MELLSTEIITLIISGLSLITSVVIAFILHSAGKKIETQNFSNSLRGSWIEIDSTVLTDEKLLYEIDRLIHPAHENSTIDEKKRRWLCYMIANALSVNYNGIRHKLLPDPKGAEASLIKSLEGLTQHPEFMEVVEYSYEKQFKELCYRIRARYHNEQNDQ